MNAQAWCTKTGDRNISFGASVGEPVLSDLTVRNKNRSARSWELVWNDEFDGDALDSSRWSPRIWPPRKVNDEDQAYTQRAKNLRAEDGHLIIEAHREDYEAAKLPEGQGTWPAIWMLPSDPFTYATTCSDDPTGRAAAPATPGRTRARSTSWSTSATRWATSKAPSTTRLTAGRSGNSAKAAS